MFGSTEMWTSGGLREGVSYLAVSPPGHWSGKVSGWALIWAHTWGRAGGWWGAGQRKLLMEKGCAVLSSWSSAGFLWPNFEYVRVKPDFYKLTQPVCCFLLNQTSFAFLLAGRPPGMLPLWLCCLWAGWLLWLQQECCNSNCNRLFDKQCPTVCSAVDSWGWLFIPTLHLHACMNKLPTDIYSHVEGLITRDLAVVPCLLAELWSWEGHSTAETTPRPNP